MYVCMCVCSSLNSVHAYLQCFCVQLLVYTPVVVMATASACLVKLLDVMICG